MARVRNSRAVPSSKTPNRIACDPEEEETAIVKLLTAAGAASIPEAVWAQSLVGFFAGGIANELIVFRKL